jgi:gas vesicle protein
MASGINIDIAANTRDFQGATRDVEAALEGVADALDDVARDTQRSAERAGDALSDGIGDGARDAARATERLGDDIADNVQEGTRDAERSTERLERSFRDLSDAASDSTRGAGDAIGDNVRRGTDEAAEGMGNLREEANSTARESAASFDGSAESIVGSFQEIAANAFAGFGPAGAVAGLAAAAGIGLVMAQFEKAGEASEAFKARVGELTQELIDVGDAQVSLEYVVDKLQEMATATDDAEVSLSDLNVIAEKSGKSYEDLASAYAGSGKDLDDLIAKTKEQQKALEASNDEEQRGLAYRDQVGGDDPRIGATQKYIDFLEQAKKAQDDAAENERLYAEANGPALAAKAELISNINDSYDEAAGGAEDFLDKESGIFDVQGFIDSMTAREQALRDYQDTLATAALTPEAKAFISSQGVDSAATFMAGYKTATPAQQAELNRIWTEAGKTSSGAFSASTRAELRQAAYEAQVKLNPDASAIRNYLNTVKTQDVLLRVQNRIDLPARSGMGVP